MASEQLKPGNSLRPIPNFVRQLALEHIITNLSCGRKFPSQLLSVALDTIANQKFVEKMVVAYDAGDMKTASKFFLFSVDDLRVKYEALVQLRLDSDAGTMEKKFRTVSEANAGKIYDLCSYKQDHL